MRIDKSKTARATLATAATLGAVAVVGDFQSWEQFLWWAAGSVGAGIFVFASIQAAEKVIRRPLDSTVKFYTALLLSFIVPVGAYLGLVYVLAATPFDRDELLAAIIVGLRKSVHYSL